MQKLALSTCAIFALTYYFVVLVIIIYIISNDQSKYEWILVSWKCSSKDSLHICWSEESETDMMMLFMKTESADIKDTIPNSKRGKWNYRI